MRYRGAPDRRTLVRGMSGTFTTLMLLGGWVCVIGLVVRVVLKWRPGLRAFGTGWQRRILPVSPPRLGFDAWAAYFPAAGVACFVVGLLGWLIVR